MQKEIFFEQIQKKISDRLQDIPGNKVLDKIFYFESNFDKQFLSLENMIVNISQKTSKKDFFEYIVFLVIQNSLICYQLSGTGESYWEEFSKYLVDYILSKTIFLYNGQLNSVEKIPKKDFFEYNDEFCIKNLEFWEYFLNGCKNNRRFTKIKLGRIQKSLDLRPHLSGKFFEYYNDMSKLCDLLGTIMNQKNNSKTIVFSIKMFSYISRIIHKVNIPFPFDIEIPIDSRITKFYNNFFLNIEEIKNLEIRNFYNSLSKYLKIPPLHLDSLLRIK